MRRSEREITQRDKLVELLAKCRVMHLGLTDALLALHPQHTPFTYWDYGAAFDANRGLRIDHVLLSPELAERCTACTVDTAPRAEAQPSDHTPVVCDIRR